MLIPVPPSECVRAREAASRRLDGELPELDAARVDVHLRRCAACRQLVADMSAITTELRRAPLESLAVAAFEPRRRRPASALRVQAAAAAIAVAAVGGSFALGRTLNSGTGSPAVTTSSSVENLASVRADSVEQRILALLPESRQRQRPRLGTAVPL